MPESTDEKKRERRAAAAEIDEMLNSVEYNAEEMVDNNTLVFENEKREREITEAEEMRAKTAGATSKELIESALGLYASRHTEVDYLRLKTKADINTFTKILCQIEINEEAIGLVMKELKYNDGANPNLLKSLSDLQKTEIELWKMKANYLATIESSLKQVSSDIEMEECTDAEAEPEDTGVARVRSSRDLMRLIGTAAETLKLQASQGTGSETDSGGGEGADTTLF